MRSSPRLLGVACAAALLVPACSSGQAAPDDGATSESASPSTSETSASPSPSVSEDPFAMPDPVTEEYVDRVVNTIYEEWGAITRELLEQPADPTAITSVETKDRIGALFGGQYLQQRLGEADDLMRGDRGAVLPLEEFTQLRIRARQVKAAGEACIVIAGDYITTGTATNGDEILATFSLQPAHGENPTGWKIIDVVRSLDPEGNRVPDEVMLDASIDELSDVLDNSCLGGGS